MRRFDEIVASFLEAAHIVKNQGLGKHAQDLDARAGALIDLDEDTSRASSTSDTGRTVTARMSPQERAELRRIRMKNKNRRPARKRMFCCDPLERRKSRGGYVWGSNCHFKYMSGSKNGQLGASWVTVSTGANKPRAVMLKGKKIPFCKSGQVERMKVRLSK